MRALRLHAIALLCGIAACGRVGFESLATTGDASGDGGDDAGSTLAITAPASALPDTTTQLAIADGAGAVTWSLETGDGGSIDAAGVLTAPASPGVVHVHARRDGDGAETVVTIRVTGSPSPIFVSDVGATTFASGMSMQQHAVWDEARGVWWAFYTSTAAPTSLLARSSSDFATWSNPQLIDLGHTVGPDGRNLAVAARTLGGEVVVHVAQSYVEGTTLGHLHVRGVLGAGVIDAPTVLPITASGATQPDGPAVAISPAGIVTDGTGWESTPQTPPLTPCGDGDVDIYTATTADPGGLIVPIPSYREQVIWCVGNRVNARYFHADGETLWHLYEDGAQDPRPVNLLVSHRRDDVWYPLQPVYTVPPAVFAANQAFAFNDWSAAVVGRALHVMRFRQPASYDHRVLDLDADGAVTDGALIPDGPGSEGRGVALVPYGTGLLAARIDTAGAVVYAFLPGPGATVPAWTPWRVLAPNTGIVRTAIAAASPVDPGAPAGVRRPVLLWTESAGATNQLVGMALP